MPSFESINGSIITGAEQGAAINTRMPRLDTAGFTYRGYNRSRLEQESSSIRYILSHNYIPEQFIFHRVNNEEELYLGVELEVDNGGEDETNAEYVYKIMNNKTENVYCKHDGSLREGFEIVTHPCTLEYHKNLDYRELFRKLSKRGYRSHDVSTCGLHVHINRNFFGDKKLDQDLNISKLLYLYEKYWDKVEIIARRKSNGYARRFLLEEDDTPLDLYAKSKEASKYGAINLKHKNTVEIRIFKGTLNTDTFYNTLEFVSVMAHIAKEIDIYEIQFVTWDKIINVFSDDLNQYIAEREEQIKKEVNDKITTDRIDDSRFNYGGLTSISNLDVAMDRIRYSSYEYLPSFGSLANMASAPSQVNAIETSEDGLILREIQDLRTRVRRSRNGLEITNLNREIAICENRLRLLRRQRGATV